MPEEGDDVMKLEGGEGEGRGMGDQGPPSSSSSSLEISLSDEDVMGCAATAGEESKRGTPGQESKNHLEEKEGEGRPPARRRSSTAAMAAQGRLERYASWYRANEHWIAPFEQALQSAIWFLPDSAGSEVSTELLHSAASMWTVANDQVLMLTEETKEMDELRTVERKFPSLLLPLLVATVEQFETVVEVLVARSLRARPRDGTDAMAANAGPLPRERYAWLSLVEAAKASLRLALLYRSQGTSCMLLDGGVSGVAKAVDASVSLERAKAKRTEAFLAFRSRYLAPPSGGAAAAAASALEMEDGPHREVVLDLRRDGARLLALAEVLHVCRPVLYCSLLYRHGAQSWKPWCVSLMAELVACYSTHRCVRRSRSLHTNPVCVRESEARWARMVLYFARSPFYDAFTRGRLKSVRRALKPVPLLGAAANAGYNLLDEIQEYYTYTSG